ncbi:MAG: hypothetical protein HYT94_00405 [Parcubacteria group bacterium]|nr:hypothetical protein [Parcubacteria group bacterium]
MKNLIATLLIVASAGLFYVYVGPTYEEIKMLRQKKAEYDEAIYNSQKIQEFRDELLNKYNSFAPNDLARLEKLLPNHLENIRLIIEADSVASRHNMILKNVQISLPNEPSPAVSPEFSEGEVFVEPTPYGTAEFSFDVTGSYSTYRGFIKDLEKSLRLIDITGISLSAEKGGKGEDGEPKPFDVYTFKTSGKTYWLR